MRYYRAFIWLMFFAAWVFSSCQKDRTSTYEQVTSPLKVPIGFPEPPFPTDNAFTLERFELGKKLFFDSILSVNNSLSCASCHQQEYGFADHLATTPGVFNRPGSRNVPTLTNMAYSPYFISEGGVPTLEMQILVPIQEHNEFAHDMIEIIKAVKGVPEYVSMSKAAYNREPDAFVITRAIATYERTLISGNSPYDQYTYQGKTEALTASQIRGLALFESEKTGCTHCHSGFTFTNFSIENNGLDALYSDVGLQRLTLDSADNGKFKVPTLRNLAFTAPYMHDGRFETLSDVLEHYNSGGANHPSKSEFVKPLNLNFDEINDLRNFLLSLSDQDFIERIDLK